MLLLIPILILILFTLFIYLKEPRTIFLGFFIILSYLAVSSGLFYGSLAANSTLLRSISGVLFVFPVLIILVISFILIFTLIFSGIRLLRKEGFSIRNMLSLLLGLFILIILFFIPGAPNETWGYIYTYVSSLLVIFSFIAASYAISSFINNSYKNFKNINYIIVLGSGLIGSKVPPLLASRINKGIEIYRKNPGSKLIMTGGKGTDELLPEGVAMSEYAIQKGVPKKDILIENKAVNTKENLLLSYDLMSSNNPNIVVVTNRYHLFRALVLARKLNINCKGAGSKTKLYFSMNAFIREFIGYIYINKKIYIFGCSLWTIIYIVIIGTYEYLK